MRFGRFLIEAGVLQPEQVADALLEQQRRRRPLWSLAMEQGASAEAVLDTAAQADERGQAFLQAAIETALLTQEQADAVHKAWQKSCPPIGKLAVELGMLEESDRQRLFNECLEKN